MNYTHWSDKMEAFLIKHYGKNGDTKLAEMFEKKFPKSFRWTKKHIEKKRYYLKLKRNPEQESRLRILNNQDGRQKRMWDKRNMGKHGEVREWAGLRYIKIGEDWVLERRYKVGAVHGEIVRTHEGALKIITRSENQRLNAEARKNLTPEIKETIKTLNQLKKLLYGKENTRPTRHTF